MSPFWRAVLRYDRSKTHFSIAFRNALGVLVPLAAGVALGNPAAGLIASIGALNVAYSDGTDAYIFRARRMLAASVCCAVALAAGAATGYNHAVAVLLAAVAAWLAGMTVAIGTTATDIANITLVTLIVFSAHPMPLAEAAQSGALALTGGLLQTALALAFWPVHPYAPERRALADLFHALSQAAAAPPLTTDAPPATVETMQAQTALADLRVSPSIEADRYLALLAQAERIRLAVMTLRRLRNRLTRDFDDSAAANQIAAALAASAHALASIADSLSAHPAPPPAAALPRPAPTPDADPAAAILDDARTQIDALAGQLRAAVELATHATPQGAADFARLEFLQPWRLRSESLLATLHANLRLHSAAFRHAVRLAACIAAGELAAFQLGWVRSYWIPMTAAIILRPDFTTTFTRGILRIVGTLCGLAAATVLFHALTPPLALQVALIFACVLLNRWFGPANYGIFVIALSALIVLLLAVTGSPPMQVIAARARGTLLGGAIALVAYALWPTWERGLVPAALARMFEAYRDYFRAIAASYIHAAMDRTAELDRTRQSARLARSNAEASAARIHTEPGISPERVRAIDAVLADSHRFIRAVMSLEAGIARSSPAPARPAFAAFARDVELTLDLVARTLRNPAAPPPADLPNLRDDHARLIATGDPKTRRYALVNTETDRITNTLNTLAQEAGRLTSTPAAATPHLWGRL